MRLIALTSILLGCADSPPGDVPDQHPVALAALPHVSAQISFSARSLSPDPRAALQRALQVIIDYDGRDPAGALDLDGSRWCPQLDASFHLTFAGLDGEPSAGGWQRAGGQGPYVCLPGVVLLPIPDELQLADAEVVLGDDSLSLRVPLGDVLRPRTISLPDGAAWRFRPGDDVTVAWSPATDLAAAPGADLSLRDSNGSLVFQLGDHATVGSDTIRFTMPDVDLRGEGSLALELRAPASTGPGYTLTFAPAASHAVSLVR